MKRLQIYAFTLSEVLITLVIIGIIAAITIPSIMANYRRIEASSKIKKFYSMLCNASTRAKADGKNWDYWAESTGYISDSISGETDGGKNFAQEYLLPYLIYYKTEQSGLDYYVYLNDGTYFYVYKGACIDFRFDINGEKKPNQSGKDKFIFLYCPEDTPYSYATVHGTSKVIPYSGAKTREDALEECKSNPSYCTGLLMIDQWEFKEDYPYNI